MGDVRDSQLIVRSFDDPDPSLRLSQAITRAVFNFPAVAVDASQLVVRGFIQPQPTVEVPQLLVRTIIRGRVNDPKVRAWTFTLDGHDFYVLRLGNEGTLVYDVFADQWYDWGTDDNPWWRAYYGANWLGGRNFANTYGSNILVGDDGSGALYFMDPEGNLDEHPTIPDFPEPFLREITGQIAVRGYDSVPCYAVSLMGAIGETDDVSLTSVTLFTSDDDGHTYDTHGTLTVVPDEFPQNARVDWNSGLGSFETPGRLFLVQDWGALKRIDWLDMDNGEDED